MNVNFNQLEAALDKAMVIVLATSKDNHVTARPVSPMNIGHTIYIRTSLGSGKAVQMLANPSVAICVDGGFYMEGTAKNIGSTESPENKEIRQHYIKRYTDAFSAEDQHLDGTEVFFEIKLNKVSQWVFEGQEPIGLAAETI